MVDALKKKVRDQLHAFLARGVQRFPRPVAVEWPAAISPNLTDTVVATSPVVSEPTLKPSFVEDTPTRVSPIPAANPTPPPLPLPVFDAAVPALAEIARCRRCPLGERPGSVCWENQPERHRTYFVLAEHPWEADLRGQAPFEAQDSPHRQLYNLLEKLGIQEDCWRSWAIKCPPLHGIPAQALKACLPNLRAELMAARPKVLLCFGTRATLAAAAALGMGWEVALGGEGRALSLAQSPWGAALRLHVFPSAWELQAWPLWKKGVWSALEADAKSRD